MSATIAAPTPPAARPRVSSRERTLELVALGGALLLSYSLVRLDLPVNLRLAGALLLLVVIPGWLLVQAVCVAPHGPPTVDRLLLALGSGYALAMLLGLLLHAVFRPIQPYETPLAAMALSLALYSVMLRRGSRLRPALGRPDYVLLGVLALAVPLRFWALDSDFQGDEALVMLRSMAMIQGLPDALIAHRKVPGEILLQSVFWATLGTTSEVVARVPFTLAGVLGVGTFYRLGRLLLNRSSAAVAAAFLAVNGYFVAFSRILQYQTVGFLLETLALLCGWRFYELSRRNAGAAAGEPNASGGSAPRGELAGDPRTQYAALAGLLACCAALIRLDAVFIIPPLLLLAWSLRGAWRSLWKPALAALWPLAGLLPAAPVIYVLRFQQTVGSQGASGLNIYLGQRIGGQRPYLNADDFVVSANHYLSTPYLLAVVSLAVLAILPPLSDRFRQRSAFGPLVRLALVLLFTGLVLSYEKLTVLAVAAGVAVLAATSHRPVGWKVALLWGTGPLLVYAFLISVPGTHWREAFPGMLLLAGGVLTTAHQQLRFWPPRAVGLSLIAALLLGSAQYVYVVWVQPWPEYEYLFPSYRQPLDLSTTTSRAATGGTFGLAHRHGWKAVGILESEGRLPGDYVTNERPAAVAWYVRRGQGCPETAQWGFQAAISPSDRRDIERGASPGFNALVARVFIEGRPSISILGRQAPPRALAIQAHDYVDRFDTTMTSPYLPIGSLYQPSVNFTPHQRGCR
ncbi:MAG: glycosyltransferase family 39 protein [Chloroflexi bacterium]|nr:glycosyltransferase family 39 protein [Chloroflexota bacterium]